MNKTKAMRQVIREGEILLRHGKSALVRTALKHVKASEISRSDLAFVASLARRSGLPWQAIRLLNPLVRPEIPGSVEATASEKVEYAAALVKIGAGEEALEIFKAVDPEEAPEVLLYQTFALTPQWRYAETIAPLRQYLACRKLTPYQAIVGKINLVAALIYERSTEAGEWLKEILALTQRHRAVLMHAHALELGAQWAIGRGDWTGAEGFLRRAEGALFQIPPPYDLFVRKWRAILEVMRSGGTAEAIARVHAVREAAFAVGHGETLRDIDAFLAVRTRDEQLLARVYFGTPHVQFRRRLLESWGEPWTPPASFLWRLDDDGTEPAGASPALDLSSLEAFRDPSVPLRTGSEPLLYRLITRLASDFYQGFRLATLHFRLYPEEYFNPESSPDRVHQALRRLRSWLGENGYPIEIAEEGGLYRLTGAPGACLEVHLSSGEPRPEDAALNRIREKWPNGGFSVAEVVSLTGFPRRSAQRLLQTLCERGRLARAGVGKATRYRFAS